MDPLFVDQEEMEDDMGLDWLFSSEEVVEDQVKFQCIHDREEFTELDDFLTHNKQFHKGFKKRCKICHNMFRDGKKVKAHVKKLHENEEFACIHDGRSFTEVNGFHFHNNNCHKKFRKVCPHSKCSNVFNGNHILQIHLIQEHPTGRPVHKKPSKHHH